MNLRTILFGVVAALFLTAGSTIVQGDPPRASIVDTDKHNSRIAQVNCGIFILPAFAPPPAIRPISERVAKSRALTEEHLLLIIKEQRDHNKEVQKKIDTEYRYYIKNCSKTAH